MTDVSAGAGRDGRLQEPGIDIWAVFCEGECYAAYSREHQAKVYASGFSKPTTIRHMVAYDSAILAVPDPLASSSEPQGESKTTKTI